MPDALVVLGLGFFLGMRHATDADHVVAIATIVTRQQTTRAAAIAGLLWGVGHSLTVFVVGAAIILARIAIPDRVGVGLELSVGLMLIVLGVANIVAFFHLRPAVWRRGGHGVAGEVHTHAHGHGDYVHTHPHGHSPDVHPHRPDQTPLAKLDRMFERARLYGWVRPVVIGTLHGLAGSAAVALLVAAAVADTSSAVAYLIVFGIGTIAGMVLITVSIASALRLAGQRSEKTAQRLGLISGVASVLFGVLFAYQVLNVGSVSFNAN
jgi:high-affinity nickel-transport protein